MFSKYLKDGFNLLEFIRFFLNIIPHAHIENLYLTIGLVDLFRQITLQTHRQKIVLKDITDFMCDVFQPPFRKYLRTTVLSIRSIPNLYPSTSLSCPIPIGSYFCRFRRRFTGKHAIRSINCAINALRLIAVSTQEPQLGN